MTEFVNMWKNYANFSDRTTVRGYWMAYLIHAIIAVPLIILTMATGNIIFSLLSMFYGLAAFIPALAMAVRRLRDSGRNWTSIFVALIPCAGIIILIVFLVKPSLPDNGIPVV